MREFWNDNGKTVTKLILNQFGAAVMGLMITAAAASNSILMLWASIFATVFYLVLSYMVIWDKGGQERIRIDGGRAKWQPWNGLRISFLANIPNILLAVLVLVGYVLGHKDGPFALEFGGNLYAISNALDRIWNGMYIGLIQTYMPDNPLAHLFIIVPSLVICTFGYYMGLSNRRLLSFFSLKSPGKSDKK